MNEQSGTVQTENTTIDSQLALACALASGGVSPDEAAAAIRVIAAKKDLSAKGSGEESYRRRLPAGETAWEWISDERLPRGHFRASERRAEVRGDVFPGDLLAWFSRQIKGGASQGEATIDSFQLVIGVLSDGRARVSKALEYTKRRDGKFAVTLPDGSVMVVNSPAWR
jgi:hypothetical protein